MYCWQLPGLAEPASSHRALIASHPPRMPSSTPSREHSAPRGVAGPPLAIILMTDIKILITDITLSVIWHKHTSRRRRWARPRASRGHRGRGRGRAVRPQRGRVRRWPRAWRRPQWGARLRWGFLTKRGRGGEEGKRRREQPGGPFPVILARESTPASGMLSDRDSWTAALVSSRNVAGRKLLCESQLSKHCCKDGT